MKLGDPWAGFVSPGTRPNGLNARFERWMYPGGTPNRLARLLNRVEGMAGAIGLWPSRLVALEVRGRQTGRPISFPLVIADFEGERYLVSMLGEGASWVRNVRSAGGLAVLRHGRREAVRLVEVSGDLRAPILRRYLSLAAGARAFIPVDGPAEEFDRVAMRIPIFRVTDDHA